MADPVARLLRLRAAEADAARRDLAAALRAHDAAGHHLAAARAAIAAEARLAPRDATHPLIGAYAAWLPSGQAVIQQTALAEAAAALALERSRTALAGARLAVRACENLADAQQAERRRAALAQEQLVLEDAVRGRK
jgi:flagellar export protein FliJ